MFLRVSSVFSVVAAFIFTASISVAQNALPRNFQAAVANQTRTLDGTPGKNYWQNSADYNINIKFDPKSRKLVGREIITYYNNSPDTLKMLVMSLYPNFYKKGVERNNEVDSKDENAGVKITKLLIGNMDTVTGGSASHDGQGIFGYMVKYIDYSTEANKFENLDDTWLYVQLQKPIPPRQMASLLVDWDYILNKGSHVRTGEIEPGAYFVAYCYPRVAVYDDVDGWNRNSYKGAHEFYNDFSKYNVSIELPEGYLCFATGTNTNASETLSSEMQNRVAQLSSTNPFTVYNPEDANDVKALTQQHKKFKTVKWNFKADNVTDFAWACSNKYKWVATRAITDNSTKPVLSNAEASFSQINSVYNPAHKDYDSVVYFTKSTIELLSHTFPAVPYPYPHITVFDGLDQMEYPMMVNDNPMETREETIELVTHEVAHMYLPFMTGCNETKYAWMDEGWATYCEHIFTHLIDTTLNDTYGLVRFRNFSGREEMAPLTTPSQLLTGESYFVNAYAKPGAMLHALEQWLGMEKFTQLQKGFIEIWQGKHPTQYDWINYFINHQPDSLNMKLFFNQWFYSFAYPDYKLSIQSLPKGSKELKIENVGNLPYPLIIEITYAEKRIEKIWSMKYYNNFKDETVIDLPFPDASPQKIRIYNPWILDVTPQDNQVTF